MPTVVFAYLYQYNQIISKPYTTSVFFLKRRANTRQPMNFTRKSATWTRATGELSSRVLAHSLQRTSFSTHLFATYSTDPSLFTLLNHFHGTGMAGVPTWTASSAGNSSPSASLAAETAAWPIQRDLRKNIRRPTGQGRLGTLAPAPGNLRWFRSVAARAASLAERLESLSRSAARTALQSLSRDDW